MRLIESLANLDALATSVRSDLATDFERKVFDASLLNFADATNPLRTSNFAYSIRELSRHILKRLAPDDHITKCQWYVAQHNEQGKEVITRAQRVQFAVHGGLSECFVVDTLDIELFEMRKHFLGVINALNKFTHIDESVFLIDDVAAEEIATATLAAFNEFFSTSRDCHLQVISSVEQLIDRQVFAAFVESSFNELDELATHHILESACVEDMHISSLDHESIIFRVEGYVECTLQYGSSSDVQRDEGSLMSESFPFATNFTASVRDPLHPSIDADTLKIDNSSWYG